MERTMNHYCCLLLFPLATFALTITGPEQGYPTQKSSLQLRWMTDTSMELQYSDNSTEMIILMPASNIPGFPTPCLYSGNLQHDMHSLVTVSGCKGQENSITIASSRVPNGLVDLSLINGITYIIRDDMIRRRREVQISEEDFVIPPPNKFPIAMKPTANIELPDGVVLETFITYDNSLLLQFGGSAIHAKEWISRVVEMAKPRLVHASLNVGIVLKVAGNMEHLNDQIKADGPTIGRLASNNKQTKLVSNFCADIGGGIVGIAYVGTACRKDGYAININEYYTDTNSELRTARTFVHELGHNVDMRHDFDTRHGGSGGSCNGKGLMSYGSSRPDAWSKCSNADFAAWYKREGFTCLKAVPDDSCSIYNHPIYHVSDRPEKCSYDSPLLFDHRFYLAKYNDLRCAFIKPGIDTYAAAANHWCEYGVKEGRQGVATSNDDVPDPASPCSKYSHPIYHVASHVPKCSYDSPLVFDHRYYLANYNDLRCAFIKPGIDTYAAAANHWCEYGVKEGRQGIAGFNSRAYLGRYQDLQRAFGKTNIARATYHYIEYGFNEKRNGN